MSCTASSHHHGRAPPPPPSPMSSSHAGLYPLNSQGKVNHVNLGNCLCQVLFISHEQSQCTVNGCYIVLPGEYGEEERSSVYVCCVMFTLIQSSCTCSPCACSCSLCACSPCACSCSLCTCSPCMCSPCTCSLWTCSRYSEFSPCMYFWPTVGWLHECGSHSCGRL